MTKQVSLPDLIGQYPVLATLSSYVSTIDLLHLGLTTRRCHALILGSSEVFDVLKRQCLCDGRGLRHRIADSLSGTRRHAPPEWITGWCGFQVPSAEETLYEEAVRRRPVSDPVPWTGMGFSWLIWRRWEEAEIEARLYARRCDAANALPCRRCGINVCEECRDYPRVLPDLGQWPNRRPHLRPDGYYENVMCLCRPCDDATERRLQGQFLSPRCDCDRYRRWICRKCTDAEAREAAEYARDHTWTPDDWFQDMLSEDYEPTKGMPGGANGRDPLYINCTCGSTVPLDTVFRCIWCKRRHRPEAEWDAERREERASIPPSVYDGGCYPMYSAERYGQNTYPRLDYQGPIYRNVDRTSEAMPPVGAETSTTLPPPSTQGE